MEKEKKNNIFSFRRRHYSFEFRVLSLVLLTLILLGISCIFMLDVINFGKDKIIYYDEEAKITYQVHLKDNDIVEEKVLKEDLEYISSLIDNISLNFKYKRKYNKKYDNDEKYYVVIDSKVYNEKDKEKIYYNNEEILIDKTNVFNHNLEKEINELVTIDYPYYNAIAKKYIDLSLPSKAEMIVTLYLESNNQSKVISSLTIPLGETSISLTKNEIKNKKNILKINPDTWDEQNTPSAFFATIFLILALIVLFRTTRLVRKTITKPTAYEQQLSDILKKYDKYIVNSKESYTIDSEKEIIKVETFEELMDARNILNKPIIYYKINPIKSEFIINDDKQVYQYILKEADIEEVEK